MRWLRSPAVGSALALVLLVAGCSGSDTGGGDESGAPGQSGSLPQVDEKWHDLYLEWLAERAAELQASGMENVPDDVEFVRFIRPDEYGSVHAECLREQGFEARERFAGVVEFGEVPPDREVALLEARYRCLVQYPVHPRYLQPFDERQIRVLYDYNVNVLKPCLEAAGHDPGEPPSWETFLATYDTDDQWVPYDGVRTRDRAEWEEINKRCPQIPPLDELYDEAD